MQPRHIFRHAATVSISATLFLTGVFGGQASLTPSVSAAAVYETKVVGGVNLRSAPSLSGRILQLVPKGQSIHVISKENAYWLKVKLQNGRTGYISANSSYTNYSGGQTGSTVNNRSNSDHVIRLAKSYMGKVSYQYGVRNTSRLIFDCSSFTQFIFAKAGVDLKWGTSQQKYQGSAVSRSNLRKGDLIFFDTSGANNRVINHVGIYMGNGQFIHNTPSKNGISIDSLNSGWWKDRYVSSRRVL